MRTELQIRAVISQGGLLGSKARLFITNSGRSYIEVGKTIYWSLNDTNKGYFRLDRGLSAGEQAQRIVGWDGTEKTSLSIDPKAWYFKNETQKALRSQ